MSAVIRSTADGLVLDDPEAAAMFRAVAALNCRLTLAAHAERVAHFRRRVAERGMVPGSALIVVLNGDDAGGARLAAMLMPPGWDESYRAAGQVPYARGLADRDGVAGAVHDEIGKAIRAVNGVAILVVDFGWAAVFTEADLRRVAA